MENMQSLGAHIKPLTLPAATTQDACSHTEGGEDELGNRQGLYPNIELANSTEDCGMELSIEW